MMRWTLVICFFILLFVPGCGQATVLQEATDERFMMDTLVTITVFCEDKQQGKAALEAAFAEFERISVLTNRFPQGNGSSALGDVILANKNSGLKPVKVSNDTVTILERCQYYEQLSGGAFDVSVGPVMELWGFGGSQRVPTDAEIKQTLDLVGYQKILLEPEQKTVYLTKRGMGIDLGSVAKGYATDQAAAVLKKRGIKHALINAGGNIYALGSKADGSPWRVGIQDPRNQQGLVAIVSVKDAAVVTSGDSQRYFEEAGVRYHHILNPATGKPAREVMQTTVIGASATDADILSTILFVLGPQRGMDFLQGVQDTQAILITPDKQITMTNQLTKQLEFTGAAGYRLIHDNS